MLGGLVWFSQTQGTQPSVICKKTIPPHLCLQTNHVADYFLLIFCSWEKLWCTNGLSRPCSLVHCFASPGWWWDAAGTGGTGVPPAASPAFPVSSSLLISCCSQQHLCKRFFSALARQRSIIFS